MLTELKEVLAESGWSQAEFEQNLLGMLARGCGAQWGRFLGVDEQGRWVERCRWVAGEGTASAADDPDPPASPGDRVAVLDGEGRVVCLPLAGSREHLTVWVLGREECFSETELELLEQAGPVAGALLLQKQLHEQARQQPAQARADEEEAARQRVGARGSLRQMVAQLERTAIQEMLWRCEGNISQAARELGMSRPGLRKKMDRYGLER